MSITRKANWQSKPKASSQHEYKFLSKNERRIKFWDDVRKCQKMINNPPDILAIKASLKVSK